VRNKSIRKNQPLLSSSNRESRLAGWFLPVALSAGFALSATSAMAQSNPQYVDLGGAAKGAYYLPDTGPAPHIAVLAIHRVNNLLGPSNAAEWNKRGFAFLGVNPRSDNNEALVSHELNALDVRTGVRFLRSQPGITKVVLLGGSGGGATTTFYQAVAENGARFCRGPSKLVECDPDQMAGFKPEDRADGVVLRDPHPSLAINTLRSLNPSVSLMGGPNSPIDPKLDPFNTRNGYNPDGNSRYSPEFQERYFKAQSKRMNDLIKQAQKIRKMQAAGTYKPADDDAFIVYHASARLSDFSTGVWRGTVAPQKLLLNNGSVRTQIVNTVRVSDPGNKETDESFSGTAFLTLSSFLSANAIKSTHSLNGISYCSSNSSTICAVQNIRAPILIVSMQGHYFIRDGEITYDNAVSADKDLIIIEGATHGGGPCTPCSAVTGKSYSNATKNWNDYAAAWINARF
jgi:hypothetical protein